MSGVSDETIERLLDKVTWRTMESAPKDPEKFIILFCLEDKTRWIASWQGGRWFGVDDMGLRREGHTEGDPEVVTGWAVNCWMPLPDIPFIDSDGIRT
jgi:hypothetical protein